MAVRGLLCLLAVLCCAVCARAASDDPAAETPAAETPAAGAPAGAGTAPAGPAARDAPAGAAGCRDGRDCLCDRLAGEPGVVFCEDFEHVTLYEDTVADGFGPWYSDGSERGVACAQQRCKPGWRAAGSYWHQRFGSASRGCLTPDGVPATPKRGGTCRAGGSPCFQPEYASAQQSALALGAGARDAWDGNARACIDIVRDGDFDDEVAGLRPPARADGAAGVFDGRQSLAHRVAPRFTSGIKGSVAFRPPLTSFGISMAVAYAENSARSGVWGHPWKHNEWTTAGGSPQGKEGIFLFHNTPPLQENDPFQHFMTYRRERSRADCEAAAAAARVRRGRIACRGSAVYVQAVPAEGHYLRSRDWPFGRWACVRGHFSGFDTAAAGIRIWHGDSLVIDVEGFDLRFTKGFRGFSEYVFNSYANANQGRGETPTSETTYRYEDNIVIVRDREPVACEAIGF